MKSFDFDRQRCERRLSLSEFLTEYNQGLPADFPQASLPILEIFSQRHPEHFKRSDDWSLDQHRKRVMDWLPNYLRSNPTA